MPETLRCLATQRFCPQCLGCCGDLRSVGPSVTANSTRHLQLAYAHSRIAELSGPQLLCPAFYSIDIVGQGLLLKTLGSVLLWLNWSYYQHG